MKEHAHVELSFRTTVSTDQTVADILAGEADVGFAALPVYSPSLQVSALFGDELFLVMSARHPLASRAAVMPADLEGERFVLFERGASIRRSTDQFFQQVRIHPPLALETNDTYFMKLMVERGLGISLLPAWAVRDEVAAGRLVHLPVEGHHLRRSVSMISLRRFPPSATRAFVEFVLAHRDELQTLARGAGPARAEGAR
jgi:DNA-binding transcriptional LysR family regulator